MNRFLAASLAGALLVMCQRPPILDADPPSRPDAQASAASPTETFAVDALFLGESDPYSAPPSATAWKQYGYDLDGLVTTRDSKDVCTLAASAPQDNQVDGDYGIDNAFGRFVLPVITSATFTDVPSSVTTSEIRTGRYTLQIQVDGLAPGAAPSTGIFSRLLVSGAYGNGVPAFDGTTDWPVLASSVSQTTVGSARVHFADGYVGSDGTFVSGTRSGEVLHVPILAGIALPIRHATITFMRSASDPTHLRNGMIAGVMSTLDVLDVAKSVAGRINPSYCTYWLDSFIEQLIEAADILDDGTNAPNVRCDAISVGIGFNAVQVANPTSVVPDPAPPPDPCASDAGTD